MTHVFAAATITTAIAVSIGVALLLEWISLRALLLLMPARSAPPRGKTL
ncbi:MAG TPA: hypothetical protein VMJ93_06945 [Verrucomicrobiae bacterium]|nr:hypothetical protein [Verrucomicrobiae bacterium]